MENKHGQIKKHDLYLESIKVTVNCFARSIQNIGLYTHEFFTSVCVKFSTYETVYKVCSNSTTIEVGPQISTFRVAHSRPELWSTLCTKVHSRAVQDSISSALKRKPSTPGIKTLCMSFQCIENLLLDV